MDEKEKKGPELSAEEKAGEIPSPAEEKEQLLEQLKAAEDKRLRLAAEYDNYRKRTQKEKESAYCDAQADFVLPLLSIVDDFERALCAVCGDEAYRCGIELVAKKISDYLKKIGVEEIDTSVGFNPELHNAIMHETDPAREAGIIGEVFQKGYTLKGKVIRHALVKVIN